jgi:formate-dependent nitrite reductase membrane component NrfD
VLALNRFDRRAIVLEFLVLAAVVVSLGAVAKIWLNVWGVWLVLGVVLLGMAAPLVVHHRRNWFGDWTGGAAALLVLLGGFILRMVIVFSSEGVTL